MLRRKRDCVSYMDMVELFSSLMKKILIMLTTYTTYFIFSCFNIFTIISKKFFSSGNCGVPSCPLPNEALIEITQGTGATSSHLCLGNALEYVGWKAESFLGREPNKPA